MAGLKFLDNFHIKTTNKAGLDFVALALILGLVNLTTSGMSDWGWMQRLNPSPWFIIPLFMGVRYGFQPGFGSGLLVMGIIFAGQSFHAIHSQSSIALGSIFSTHIYYFLSFPITGFLAGETHTMLAKKIISAEQQIAELTAKEESVEARLDVAEEARHQLQQRLALHGAEQSNLDRQLRALFEPTAGAILPNLLRLLRDMAGVTDAGIYAIDGSNLKRLALLGDGDQLPASLSVAENPIVKVAIEQRKLVTVKDVWQETPDFNAKYLAALPWMGHGENVAALLVIHRMNFLATNWQNFHRIQLVCRWVAQFVDLRLQAAEAKQSLSGKSPALIVPETTLDGTLHLAEATHKEWNLPSAMAVFEFTEDVNERVATLLPQTVGTVMRATDVGSIDLKSPRPRLQVLLPMDGAAEGMDLLDKALSAISKVPELTGKVTANLALTERDPEAVSA
jgi:hypothetical protein